MNWFGVLLGTMEQRPRVVRGIVFTCVVLHNMMRTHQGGGYSAPTPANEQAVYLPNENYKNLYINENY